MNKKLIRIVTSGSLLVVLFNPLKAGAADDNLSVGLAPTSVSVQQQQSFSLQISGNTGTVSAKTVWVNIYFDSSLITLNGFSRGSNPFSDCATTQPFIGISEVTAICWNADESTAPPGNYPIGTLSFTANKPAQTQIYSDTSSSTVDANDMAHDSSRVDVPVSITALPPPPPSDSGGGSTSSSNAPTPTPTSAALTATNNQTSSPPQPQTKAKSIPKPIAANLEKPSLPLKKKSNLQLTIVLPGVAVMLGAAGIWKHSLISKYLGFRKFPFHK